MTKDEIKQRLASIESKIRVTKVVATRSVKGKGGDVFAGFSAGWESVQDDSAMVVEDSDVTSQGMTLDEARIAHLIVAQAADIAAHEQALATGSISTEFFRDRVRGLQTNYAKLIAHAMGVPHG